MPSDGTIILTDTGETRLNAAAALQVAVRITHVAAGDGNGDTYDPDPAQAALRGERARVAITRRHLGGPNAWRITAEFPADTEAFTVRELGFFDEDGDLILVWAGADVTGRRTGAIDYLVEQALVITGVRDGLLIVDGPDDALFDLAVATAAALTNLQIEQLRQAERLRRVTGAY